MHVIGNLLLYAHLLGFGAAIGSGITLSRIGPKLGGAAVAGEQLWPLFKFFSRMAAAGLLVLLVTGPLMLWLKFGGTAELNTWFWVKMIFVGLAVAGIGLHEWARPRFARGDASARSLMAIGGRLAGFAISGAMFCAVFAFN